MKTRMQVMMIDGEIASLCWVLTKSLSGFHALVGHVRTDVYVRGWGHVTDDIFKLSQQTNPMSTAVRLICGG